MAGRASPSANRDLLRHATFDAYAEWALKIARRAIEIEKALDEDVEPAARFIGRERPGDLPVWIDAAGTRARRARSARRRARRLR